MGFCCITNMQTGTTNNKWLPMSCWAFGDTPRTFTLPSVITYFWFLQWSFPALLKCFISPLLLYFQADHIFIHKIRQWDVKRLPFPSFPPETHQHMTTFYPGTEEASSYSRLTCHQHSAPQSLQDLATHITSPSNVFPPLHNINIKASPILTK